jgi:hypothetical protein
MEMTMTDIQPVESSKTKTKKRAQPKTQKPQPDFYDAAVAEGKQIVQKIERAESGRMRLGELADRVRTKYGENKLKQYAKEIGMALCTLERSRSVWRAWKDKSATPPNFSVAQELQTLPNCAQIVKSNPNITVREARKERLAHKEREQQQANPVDKMKKRFEDLLLHVSKVVGDAEIIKFDAEQRRNLKKAITQPALLSELLEGERQCKAIYEFLKRLVDEPA